MYGCKLQWLCVFEISVSANQQSPKSGDSLHKPANGSSPDAFPTPQKKEKAVWPRETKLRASSEDGSKQIHTDMRT